MWKSFGIMALWQEGLEVLGFIPVWTVENKRKASDRQVHSYLRQEWHHFQMTFQSGSTSRYCQRQMLSLILIFIL